MNLTTGRLLATLGAALLATIGCAVGGGGGSGFSGGGRADPSAPPVPCTGNMLQTAPSCDGDRLDAAERVLFDLINAWRAENGRHAIPFSASLTLVANRHVRDLNENALELHSWTGCPYVVSNRSTYDCMWRAPQRLGTRYRGNGYENSYIKRGGNATAQGAIDRWKGSDLHNGVILNTMGGGINWGQFSWRALGVAIYGSYAVMWVGDQTDPDRTPMAAASPQWFAVHLDDLLR